MMLDNRLLPLWIPTRRCDGWFLQGLTKTMRMCTAFTEIQVLCRNVYVTFLKEIIQKGKDKKLCSVYDGANLLMLLWHERGGEGEPQG